MALIDFTLSNARRFYSSVSVGNPLGWKGLRFAELGFSSTSTVGIMMLFSFNKVLILVALC